VENFCLANRSLTEPGHGNKKTQVMYTTLPVLCTDSRIVH